MVHKRTNWRGSNNDGGRYGWAWKKTRLRILKRDNYQCQCKDCKCLPRPLVANEVDHIIPIASGGTDEDSNLQAINKDCHKRKTKLDEGMSPSYGADINGIPLDPNHPWYEARKKEMEELKRKHKAK